MAILDVMIGTISMRWMILVALLICVILFAFDAVSKRAVGIVAIILLALLVVDGLR